MKSIDKEIFEIEQRLRLREAAIKQAAREAKQRSVKALTSPATIAGALALGFVVAGGLGRRRAKGQALSQETKEKSKGFALGSLLMTGAMWFVRNQFGGPAGLAHFVLSKTKKSPRGDSRSA